MKKLIFVVICFALVFAGYRAEVGTGSVARGSSEGSDARAISAGPRMGIPPSSDRHQQESSASDAQILVISTLIALAIVADETLPRNDCAASVNCHNPGR
jgi:hypothetical protein